MTNPVLVGAAGQSSRLIELVQLLVSAWNRADAEAFAALFTPDAEYFTGAGGILRGRSALVHLVGSTPGIPVHLVGEPSVECSLDRGYLSFEWSMAGQEGHSRLGRISCTCIHHESGWLIASLRNAEQDSIAESRISQTENRS